MIIGKPVKNVVITSKFGVTRMIKGYLTPKVHYGVDIGCPIGTDGLAVADGLIFQITDFGKEGFGKFLVLKTVYQRDVYYFFYAHLSQILVKKGQQVKQGQIIVKTGNSGFSIGPHLHFQICKNGLAIKDYPKICLDPEKLWS